MAKEQRSFDKMRNLGSERANETQILILGLCRAREEKNALISSRFVIFSKFNGAGFACRAFQYS